MKNKVTAILGIAVLAVTMFFNVSLLSNQNVNDNLVSMLTLNTANAIQEQGGDDCTSSLGAYTSDRGFKALSGTACYDKWGDYCGDAYDCVEDTSLPKLPENQFAVCNKSRCAN